MIKSSTNCIDITPTYPIHILGHAMRKEKSKGVHDRIEAVLLWLTIENQSFLFIAIDLLGVDEKFVNEIRECIRKKITIDSYAIHICATHTHSAPLINNRDSTKQYDPQYRKWIQSKIIDASYESYEQQVEVADIFYRAMDSYGYYGNRNDIHAEGDQRITRLEFFDKTRNKISELIHLSCHATVLNPMEYQLSADLLGSIRREMAQQIIPLVVNGAAGDMSTRNYRKGNDFNELARVSKGICHQIQTMNAPIRIQLKQPKTCHFCFHTTKIIDMKEVKHKLLLLQKQVKTNEDTEKKKWLYSEIQDFEEQLQKKTYDLDFNTTVHSFGDLTIVCLPCELSSYLGKLIKRHSCAQLCLIVGYCDGQTTYVVEATAFEQGHSGAVTKLNRDDAENYVNIIIQKMRQIEGMMK